jgi:hypothetical protein
VSVGYCDDEPLSISEWEAYGVSHVEWRVDGSGLRDRPSHALRDWVSQPIRVEIDAVGDRDYRDRITQSMRWLMRPVRVRGPHGGLAVRDSGGDDAGPWVRGRIADHSLLAAAAA